MGSSVWLTCKHKVHGAAVALSRLEDALVNKRVWVSTQVLTRVRACRWGYAVSSAQTAAVR